jgi:hypothetical protein
MASMPTTRAKPVRAKTVKKKPAKKSIRGAAKGGIARAKNLSPRRRKQIARQAALARWGKKKVKKRA